MLDGQAFVAHLNALLTVYRNSLLRNDLSGSSRSLKRMLRAACGITTICLA